MMPNANQTALPLSARLIIVFGIVWAVIALAFLPFILGLAYGQDWSHWLKLMWLLLPMVVLLTSLKYWYVGRRTDAVADAIAAAGVSFVWLLVVVITTEGREMDWGSLPYLAVVALLAFTILSFWAFLHSFGQSSNVGRSPALSWAYWGLFAGTLVTIVVTCGLVFYLEILAT